MWQRRNSASRIDICVAASVLRHLLGMSGERVAGVSWRGPCTFLAVNLIACLLNEAKFVLIN